MCRLSVHSKPNKNCLEFAQDPTIHGTTSRAKNVQHIRHLKAHRVEPAS